MKTICYFKKNSEKKEKMNDNNTTPPQKATSLDQTEGSEIENFSFNDNPPASTFSYLFQSYLMLFKM